MSRAYEDELKAGLKEAHDLVMEYSLAKSNAIDHPDHANLPYLDYTRGRIAERMRSLFEMATRADKVNQEL